MGDDRGVGRQRGKTKTGMQAPTGQIFFPPRVGCRRLPAVSIDIPRQYFFARVIWHRWQPSNPGSALACSTLNLETALFSNQVSWPLRGPVLCAPCFSNTQYTLSPSCSHVQNSVLILTDFFLSFRQRFRFVSPVSPRLFSSLCTSSLPLSLLHARFFEILMFTALVASPHRQLS